MGRRDIQQDGFTRAKFFCRRRINGQRIAFIDNLRIEPELLGSAVIIEEAVIFPFDVVEFGIDVSGNLLVPAKLIGKEFETPTDIAIAIKSSDAAIFAVDQRLPFVEEARDIIETGTDEI